jgi:ferritin-like metal-binding protein YciE
MKNQSLYQLFVDELEDMYSAENQILESFPKLIKLASSQDLKDTLSKHYNETEAQVQRIEECFSILGISPKKNTCEAMEGLLREANEIVQGKSKSPVLDAAIISAAQKVEHYEIASYGTLRSFAKHLEMDSKISDLLTETINEEGEADKALTKIAEGSIFTTGVNNEAVLKSQK